MEGLSILSRQIYGMCDIVLYETNLPLYQIKWSYLSLLCLFYFLMFLELLTVF